MLQPGFGQRRGVPIDRFWPEQRYSDAFHAPPQRARAKRFRAESSWLRVRWLFSLTSPWRIVAGQDSEVRVSGRGPSPETRRVASKR